MPTTKKKNHKSQPKPSSPKVSKVKASSSSSLKKTASRIKKVRTLQQGFPEVVTSRVMKLEENPVVKARVKAASRKGFLNKACFKLGSLFSDATALLETGKKE
ncbi:MAG: hypothetical protein HQL13_02375 [Candidatus Omnitrophica bacterium]|nr:hypothetical protein [Candidatus Omnitrophota bacterium]